MKAEIKEYSEAVQAHLDALGAEVKAKDAVRKSYYRLIQAKEALRAMERDIIEESERMI